MKHKDLAGLRFNMLEVISFAYIKDSHSYWNCKCDCGNTSVVCGSRLVKGLTKSCGCLGPKLSSKRNRKHGKSNTRLYKLFYGMRERCYNEQGKDYKNYGGRGIKICDEWLSNPLLFIEWAYKNGYNDKLSIDRIDVNEDYTPNNCRWVSFKKQANNRRNNLIITFEGKTMSAAEWCEFKGWNRHVIPERLRNGWSLEKAMTTPLRIRGGK